jgi:hypothetical protein
MTSREDLGLCYPAMQEEIVDLIATGDFIFKKLSVDKVDWMDYAASLFEYTKAIENYLKQYCLKEKENLIKLSLEISKDYNLTKKVKEKYNLTDKQTSDLYAVFESIHSKSGLFKDRFEIRGSLSAYFDMVLVLSESFSEGIDKQDVRKMFELIGLRNYAIHESKINYETCNSWRNHILSSNPSAILRRLYACLNK